MIQQSHTRLVRLLTISGLLLLVVALYVPYLDITMKCDEANTLYQYASDLPRALLSYVTPNNHILHSVLVWLLTSLAGTSNVVARFPAFAAALLAVAMAYRVGSQWGGVRAGVGALVFTAANLGFAGYAVNARGYTLSVWLTLVLIDQVFFTSPSRRQRYTLLAVSAGLILVLPSMAILVAAALLWLIWKHSEDSLSLLAPIVMGCAAASIIYAPSLLAGTLSQDFTLFGETDPLALLSNWVSLIFGTPFIGIIFAACVIVGLMVLLTTSRYILARQITLVVFGTTLVLAAAQFILTHKFFYERNYLFLLAPLSLIAGVGLSRVTVRGTLPAGLVLLALTTLSFPSLRDPTEIDGVLTRVHQYTTSTDGLMVAPCWNAPVLYDLRHTGRESMYWSEKQHYSRVFVVSRVQTLDEILDIYDARDAVTDCQQDDDWLPYVVYRCSPR